MVLVADTILSLIQVICGFTHRFWFLAYLASLFHSYISNPYPSHNTAMYICNMFVVVPIVHKSLK